MPPAQKPAGDGSADVELCEFALRVEELGCSQIRLARAAGFGSSLESRLIEEEQKDTKSAQTLAYVTSLEAPRPGVSVLVRAGTVPPGMWAN